MRTQRLAFCAAVSAISAVSMFAGRDAHACGGAVADLNINEQRLARAYLHLENGRYMAARAHVVPVNVSGDDGEKENAKWITAMSFVRDEYASDGELREAVSTMRMVRSHRTLTDVKSQVDLGEALSRLPETRDEARKILEPLAQQDLIGSDHAYARLVRVGSTLEVRATAFQRCRTIAKEPSLCWNGYIAEQGAFSDSLTAAKWVPRGFVGLGALAILGAMAGIASVIVRIRRRSLAIATFA
jgi:hypothetical protein